MVIRRLDQKREMRSLLREFLECVIRDTIIYSEDDPNARWKTVTAMDVENALSRQCPTLYYLGGEEDSEED
ncbi:hypothetical protein NQ315_000024 [Exocentrus adspersus]|uniref:Histone H4 n=1 Tax=Exocentrus adspersus TaxID=1586481 RepID=A0AAV8VFQ1_9CUCU|nr:hypothetical protein NQ315_000024 [Exocentrus adspersus]